MLTKTSTVEKKNFTDAELDGIFVNVTRRSNMPFQVYIGSRGDGKTFSALRSTILEEVPVNSHNYIPIKSFDENKFMYIRRRDKEIQIATSETANPFKTLNRKYNQKIIPKWVNKEKITHFYRWNDDGTKDLCGFSVALATFNGMRGTDFSDVNLMIFDEAIPDDNSIKMSNEGFTFFNLYETVVRNKEIVNNTNPITCYIMMNAIDMSSDLFQALNIVSTVAHMIDNNQRRMTFKERGLYIEIIENTPEFNALKAETALYKLTKGTDFYKFALENQFTMNDRSGVRKVNLTEYKPIWTYNNTYTLYAHKSKDLYHFAEVNPKSNQHRYKFASLKLLRTIYKSWYIRYSTFMRVSYDTYATKIAVEGLLLDAKYTNRRN